MTAVDESKEPMSSAAARHLIASPTPVFALPLEIGRVLCGRWTVERLIGLGGMSVVYRARHRNGRTVALKVLRPELASRTNARARFLREGYIANRIQHPGVVSILDDDCEGSTIFLVMELLVGETLGARWKRAGRRLPLAEALFAADAVLDVLIAAHAEGVAHRDLKPENVFLCRDGRVKVLDFGIASSLEMRASKPITKTGLSFGTPGFMAREQARGLWDEVDGQTDLWALGATLFTLLSGRYVFEGASPADVTAAAATQVPDSIAKQLPGLPSGVVELIDRALCVDKAERWRDALGMQDALRALLERERILPYTLLPHALASRDSGQRVPLASHIELVDARAEELGAVDARGEPRPPTTEDVASSMDSRVEPRDGSSAALCSWRAFALAACVLLVCALAHAFHLGQLDALARSSEVVVQSARPASHDPAGASVATLTASAFRPPVAVPEPATACEAASSAPVSCPLSRSSRAPKAVNAPSGRPQVTLESSD